ncbi:uncharacterized protein [Miscanthus floridulus]|uniref:uncharacterized protein n=1 Tax=Miscanthus floridulus TaxID=154761 RepID=UPI003459E3F3
MTATMSSVVYDDDEAPVEPPPAHASRNGVLVLNAHCEYPAVPNVSESMLAGAKLVQVKRVMGPWPSVVEAFQASGASTNVRAGLEEAAKVLGGCLHWNDVAAMILVSDGHESCVVPQFFYSLNSARRTPVHTFGLGSGVDAAAMHSISEVTGGTFSFIEDLAGIQDALAQCIAGLLSVSGKDSKVEIECSINPVNDDVINVTAVKSGRYKNGLERPYDQTWVYVGELYADEERRILQPVDVELADVDIYVEIERPVEVKPTDMARCKEVERQLLRVAAAEDMDLTREAAERGAHAEAAWILDARRESLSRSAAALSGDAMCTALVAELHELSRRVSGEREYRKTGRACFLASMSSHALQRGSSSVRFGCVDSSVFATPAMQRMEKLSVMMRKRQEAAPPLQENGRKTTVPRRSRLEP